MAPICTIPRVSGFATRPYLCLVLTCSLKVGSIFSICRLIITCGTQKQRPQAWSLDSNVVFPELPECLSLIDFQRPVPEKKKIIFPPFSTRQPASICSLSVYPAWTCNPNKEFPREEQRKEKKTLVAFPNPFFLGSSEIPPTLGWPPAAPRSSGCTIVLTPRASLTEGRA